MNTRNAIAAVIAAGATVFVTLAAVPASASSGTASTTAGRTRTIGSCGAAGDHAACALSVQANRPALLHAYLTATPNQVIKGSYSFQCAKDGAGAGAGGSFDSKGPFKFNLRPGFANPATCSLRLQGRLPGSGRLHFSVTVTEKK